MQVASKRMQQLVDDTLPFSRRRDRGGNLGKGRLLQGKLARDVKWFGPYLKNNRSAVML